MMKVVTSSKNLWKITSLKKNVESVSKGGGLEEKTEFKPEDKLQWGNLEISKNSSQKVLKEAAEHLGLSKAGSKKKIWKRMCKFQKEERLKNALISSGKLRRELEGPQPQGSLPIKQKNEGDVKLRACRTSPGAKNAANAGQTKFFLRIQLR